MISVVPMGTEDRQKCAFWISLSDLPARTSFEMLRDVQMAKTIPLDVTRAVITVSYWNSGRKFYESPTKSHSIEWADSSLLGGTIVC